ncbi:E3 SUMO-protein ligase RanBP2-like [Tachypleus tridentatus]|uniref:E3 SUMO-protein ligase RanBP2-like n=1 Tax=Tachypleus tridentatus TaxID=6853 RepID=UPI003FD46340
MFRSKKEVDKHVADILNKINNENERNLRGYSFARLYYQIKDYDKAKRYLAGFLSVRESHAAAHKLMGQIYESCNNLEKALQSYKKSLELEENQKDVVIKICELYTKLPVDPETARYWADRAERLFLHHEIVFSLRECIVTAEGEPNVQELEDLIASELAARPRDVHLRIKLLKLYMDTERVQDAYSHATKVESKCPFPTNVMWYYFLSDVFETYLGEMGNRVDLDFHINYLAVLEHLVSLTLAEPHVLDCITTEECNNKQLHSVGDVASAFDMFDQELDRAWKVSGPSDSSWNYVLHHMSGQLYFHLGTLLLKRAKKEQGNWKEACRTSAALYLTAYTFKPESLAQQMWFLQLGNKQKLFTKFHQQGLMRLSVTGHVLMALCKGDKTKWLQKIKQEVCVSHVRERIFQRLFPSVMSRKSTTSCTSYFLKDQAFLENSLEFPTWEALEENDKVASKLQPELLHHLVWLALHYQSYGDQQKKDPKYKFEVFDGLKHSSPTLNSGAPESLSLLDVQAFLHATVYTANLALEQRRALIHHKAADAPLCVPSYIADPLCTNEQASWWKATYKLYANIAKEKLGELRRTLQRGLEVIRGVGNHGMDVSLVVHLARLFTDQASELRSNVPSEDTNTEKMLDIEARASHYWTVALSMLDKLAVNQTLRTPKDRLFPSYGNEPSSEEVSALQEEGRLFLACRAMNDGCYNEAVKEFSSLKSAYASFYLAQVKARICYKSNNTSCESLKKLSEQELGCSPRQNISTTVWNNYISLLNRTRDALYLTMDRIRGDKYHSLNAELDMMLEEVENKLSAVDRSTHSEENQNGEENGVLSESSDSQDKQLQESTNLSRPWQSTPQKVRGILKEQSERSNLNLSANHREYVRPSPERLDAQIRAMARTQNVLIQTLLDQQQEVVKTNHAIVEELKLNRTVIEELKEQLKGLHLVAKCWPKQRFSSKSNASQAKEGESEEEEEGKDLDEYEENNYLSYYPESLATHDFRNTFGYGPPSMVTGPSGPSGVNYYQHSQDLSINQYHYPPPAGPPSLHTPKYFPPPPPLAASGLPFSEGQQLPQFSFPPPPPNAASLSAGLSRAPVFGCLGHEPAAPLPPGSIVPPSGPPPMFNVAQPLRDAPHAFQIPLPSTVTAVTQSITLSGVTFSPSVLSSTSELFPSSTPLQLQMLLNKPPVLSSQKPGSLSNNFRFDEREQAASALYKHSKVISSPVSPDKDKSLEGGRESVGSDGDHSFGGDFKPLIPLPDEVPVQTGEEDEKVLFENRAKLFRFVDKEWKERGVGTIKLLLHEISGKVRLLMRRDQILKICANHYICPEMDLKLMKGSDRAWIWCAQDFADEEIKTEKFCIRFKTVDIAEEFKKAFEKSIEIVKNNTQKSQEPTKEIAKEPKSENVVEEKKISEDVKFIPGSQLSSVGFGDKFKLKPGNWICDVCLVTNSAEKNKCQACDSPKPGLQLENSEDKSTSLSKFTFGITSQSGSGFGALFAGKQESKPTESSFHFGIPGSGFSSDLRKETFPVSFSSSSRTNVSGEVVKGTLGSLAENITQDQEVPKASADMSSSSQFGSASFILNQMASRQKEDSKQGSNVFGGFSFTNTPVIQDSSQIEDHQIKQVGLKSKETSQKTEAQTKSSPFAQFSFKLGSSVNQPNFDFLGKNKEENVPVKEVEDNHIFGSDKEVSTLTFSALSTTKSPEEIFGKSSNFKGFPGSRVSVFGSSSTKEKSNTSGNEVLEEYEPNVEFKPVIPLPELVELQTGEEQEEKLFCERAKLFRYASDAKQWKDRGIGELKILRHQQTGKCRILMRREQVLKLCANHYIVPGMTLSPLSSSDRAWVWSAQDYSEGELKQEQLAVKFKAFDIANEFRRVFEKCQTEAQKLELCPAGIVKSSMPPVKAPDSSKVLEHTTTNQSPQLSLTEMFKPKPGSWECNVCYVRNNGDDTSCQACATSRPGSEGALKIVSDIPKNSTPGFKFSFSADIGKQHTIVSESQKQDKFQFKVVSQDEGSSEFKKPQNSVFGSIANSSSSGSFGSFVFGGQTSSPKFSVTSDQKSDSRFVFGSTPSSSSYVFGSSSAGMAFGSTKPLFVLGSDDDVTSRLSTPVSETDVEDSHGHQASEMKMSLIKDNVKEMAVMSDLTAITGVSSSSSTPATSIFTFGTPTSGQDDAVQFRFGSPQKHEFSFSGVRPRSPSKTPNSPGTPTDIASKGAEEEEEVEPSEADNVYFHPVIPLPPKIEVKTGEEGEEVLYSHRAKLYIFVQGEWKERGIGNVKLLLNSSTNQIRLLMRRDQVLKVCLNHSVTSDIKFWKKDDRSWTWGATDFSEGEPNPARFAIRFKSDAVSHQFKTAIDDAQKQLSNGQMKSKWHPTSPDNILAEKPDSKPSPLSTFSFRLDKQATPSAKGFSLTDRFGIPPPSTSRNLFGNILPKAQDRDDQGDDDIIITKEKQASDEKRAKAEQLKLPPNFYLYEEKPPCPGCRGCDKEVEQDEEEPVQITYEKKPTKDQIQLAEKLKLPPTFFMYEDKPPCPGMCMCYVAHVRFDSENQEETDTVSFDVKSSAVSTESSSVISDDQQTLTVFCSERKDESIKDTSGAATSSCQTISSSSSTDSSVFGANLATSYFSFESLAAQSSTFDSAAGFALKTKGDNNSFVFAGAGKPLFGGVKDQDSAAGSEQDDTQVVPSQEIHFEPAIPLPKLVETKTGEEEELPVFCQRAKLYRFDKNVQQWKERGVGDFKILKHKNQCRFRLILRRQQVHKIACNHYITADMELKPMPTSENAVCWTAIDFADEQPVSELLAVRFKTKELVEEFKEKFEECRKAVEMKIGDTEESVPVHQSEQIASTTTNKEALEDSSKCGSISIKELVENINSNTEDEKGNISEKMVKQMTVHAENCENISSKDLSESVQITYEKKPTKDQIQLAEKLKLPPTFFMYEDKPPCPGCRGCIDNENQEETDTVSFDVKSSAVSTEASSVISDNQQTLTVFCSERKDESIKDTSGAATSSCQTISSSSSTDSSVFGANLATSYFSFESLAAQSSTFNTSTESSPTKSKNSFVFAGAGKPLFGCVKNQDSVAGNEQNDTQVLPSQEIHFEPAIPLPELVETKTGEEEELPVFCQRAKLYRFDKNVQQWKERGVGDFKILKHKNQCRFRLILRRQQVHKIACNHYITADMELKPMPTSENAVCWTAIDFADEQPVSELLAVRFKTKELVEEFKEKFEECRKAVEMKIGDTEESVPGSVHQCDQSTTNTNKETLEDSSSKLKTIDMKKLIEGNNDEEEEEDVMFEKRISFFIFDQEINNYKFMGVGPLRVLYDDSVFGARVQMHSDQGDLLCDHIIAVETTLRSQQREAFWVVTNTNVDPPVEQQFKAVFSSSNSLQDFCTVFQEGKQMAAQAEISETCEEIPPENLNVVMAFFLDQVYQLEPGIPVEPCQAVTEELSSQYDSVTCEDVQKLAEGNNDGGDEEEEDIMFEESISFSVYDQEVRDFKLLGVGPLRVLYDDSVFGARVQMHNDQGDLLCDHIIAVQTCLRSEQTKAFWAAIDMSMDPPIKRQYQAVFSSPKSLEDFCIVFEEGKQLAVQAEILEKDEGTLSSNLQGETSSSEPQPK